jgi:hypothetical protein
MASLSSEQFEQLAIEGAPAADRTRLSPEGPHHGIRGMTPRHLVLCGPCGLCGSILRKDHHRGHRDHRDQNKTYREPNNGSKRSETR